MNCSRTTILLATVLITALLPQLASAATWTVEKDGSGHFTIIQDALDAAAPGDSILVGPGRFETLHPKRFLLDGIQASSVVWFRKPDLTLIGSGSRQTIIGPSTYVAEHEGGYTASVVIDSGSPATLRDVGMENTRYEFHVFANSLIEDCRIERLDGARSGTFAAWFGYSDGSALRRCEMINTGGLTTIFGVTSLLIEDCYFEELQERNGSAVHLGNGAQDCIVRRSEFVGGGGGIQAGGGALVEDCTLTGMRVFGLEAWGGGGVLARRLHIGTTSIPVSVNDGYLELYDSVLEGGTLMTLQSSGDIYARGNHILNGGATTVDSNSRVAQGEVNDLRYNWWGTSDPAQIEAWIVEYEAGTVLWQPYNDMPVPTERESISGLKGKFGRN